MEKSGGRGKLGAGRARRSIFPLFAARYP